MTDTQGITPDAAIRLLHLVSTGDLIGCTSYGTLVALGESCCIEGYRVCEPCFGLDPPRSWPGESSRSDGKAGPAYPRRATRDGQGVPASGPVPARTCWRIAARPSSRSRSSCSRATAAWSRQNQTALRGCPER